MPAATSQGASRLYFVDRLRLAATGVILGYHSARAFDDFELWHVKYDRLSPVFTWPVAIGSQVALPLFWLLSGIVTWAALEHHPPGRFLARRAQRLLVPLVVLGWPLLTPPQVYIEATTDQRYLAPPFEGSYAEFLMVYPTSGWYGRGGWFAVDGLHLWYLGYLALYTALLLPVLLALRRPAGRRLLERLGAAGGRPWPLLALGLAVVATELLLPSWLPMLGWYQGGWRLGTYAVILLLGFVLGADERLREAAARHRRLWLGLALATLVPLLAWAPGILSLQPGSLRYVLEWGLRSFNGWLCLLAVLGYGAHHLAGPGRLPAAAAELVLPVYILHQPVIVVTTWALLGSALPALPAFLLVVATTVAVSLAGALVVRRSRLLRPVFGLAGPPPPRGGVSRAGTRPPARPAPGPPAR